MNIFQAFSGVFSIVLMGAIGYFATKKKLIDPMIENFISKFALNVTIPLLIFSNGYQFLTREFIKTSAGSLLAATALILVCYLLGYLAAVLFKVKRNERGVCAMMFSLSNNIFIGLPVCIYYFGKEAVPAVMIYFIANTLVFWTVGTALVARDGGEEFKWGFKILKNFLSPQVISFFVGGAVGMLGITLPGFMNTVIDDVGGMTTPLVTILAGAVVARIGIAAAFKPGKPGLIALAGRFIIAPAVAIAMVSLLSLPTLTANVFIAENSMPVMNQTMLIAKYYKANDVLVTKTLVASILLMTVALPLIILIAGRLTA